MVRAVVSFVAPVPNEYSLVWAFIVGEFQVELLRVNRTGALSG